MSSLRSGVSALIVNDLRLLIDWTVWRRRRIDALLVIVIEGHLFEPCSTRLVVSVDEKLKDKRAGSLLAEKRRMRPRRKAGDLLLVDSFAVEIRLV